MFSRARAPSFFFSSVSASQRDAPSMFRATASAIARTASRRAARANNAQRFMSSGASVEEEIGTSHRASSFIHSFIIERRVRVTRTARSRSLMRPLAAPSRALHRGHTTLKRHSHTTFPMMYRSMRTAEMNKWRAVSAIAIPACAGFAVYTLSNVEHPHKGETEYSYLKIRNREQFPWGGDCSLFEHRDDCA